MSQENVEIVGGIYDGWARNDFSGSGQPFDAQIEYVNPPGAIEPGTRSGLAAFRRAVEQVLGEAWESWRIEPERLNADALGAWELEGRKGERPEPTLPAIEADIARLQHALDGLRAAVDRSTPASPRQQLFPDGLLEQRGVGVEPGAFDGLGAGRAQQLAVGVEPTLDSFGAALDDLLRHLLRDVDKPVGAASRGSGRLASRRHEMLAGQAQYGLARRVESLLALDDLAADVQP